MTDASDPSRPLGPNPAGAAPAPSDEATTPWPQPAPRVQPPAPTRGYALPAGARVGQVTIRRMIGLGGFGVTYEGENALGVRVAVKEFRPATLLGGAPEAEGEAGEARKFRDWALRRFEASTRALFELSHPAIVKVFDYVRAEDANGEPTGFMVMEFVDGRPLSAEIEARGGRVEPGELLRLLEPVLDALSYLHALGRAHRDVAPDNIMVRPDGRAVLIDFGEMKAIEAEAGLAARAQIAGAARGGANGPDAMPPLGAHATAALAQTTRAVAKPFYSPPEQRSVGAAVSPAGDVYALGAVIYRAVAGAPPLDADDRIRALTLDGADPHEPLAVRAPHVPAALARAVDAALSLRVADRPADMAAFAARLRDVDAEPAGHAATLSQTTVGPAAPATGAAIPSLGGVTRPGRPSRSRVQGALVRNGVASGASGPDRPAQAAENDPDGGPVTIARPPRRRAGLFAAASAAALLLVAGAAAWVSLVRRPETPRPETPSAASSSSGASASRVVAARTPEAPRNSEPSSAASPSTPAAPSPAPTASTVPATPANPRATPPRVPAEPAAPRTAADPAASPAGPTLRPLVPPPAADPRRPPLAASTAGPPAGAPTVAPPTPPAPGVQTPGSQPLASPPSPGVSAAPPADRLAAATPEPAPTAPSLPPPLTLPGAGFGGSATPGEPSPVPASRGADVAPTPAPAPRAADAGPTVAPSPRAADVPPAAPPSPSPSPSVADLRRPVPPAALPDPRSDAADAAPSPAPSAAAPTTPATRPPPLPAPVEIASAPTVAAIEPRAGPDPAACRREVAAASGAIRFAPGRADLDPASHATLASLARAVELCRAERVEVATSAAADEAETLRDAERLARARAGAVIVALSAAGLSEARLVARAAPVGGDPAAPDEERRVRFRVVP